MLIDFYYCRSPFLVDENPSRMPIHSFTFFFGAALDLFPFGQTSLTIDPLALEFIALFLFLSLTYSSSPTTYFCDVACRGVFLFRLVRLRSASKLYLDLVIS